jgi:hypothetical protein
VSPEERSGLLKLISIKLHTTPDEIMAAMYGDKESEQILKSVPEISYSTLSRKFNLEQIETVMLRSTVLTIKTSMNHLRFIRRMRSLGLLYEESAIDGKHILKVSGPVSILEHTERYGSRLALLIRYISGYSDWEIDAEVTLKSGKEKNSYQYHLDSSVTPYIYPDDSSSSIFKQETSETSPIKLDKTFIIPDTSIDIDGEKVSIVLTRPPYYEDDHMQIQGASRLGFNIALVCLIDNDEKCPKGAICLKGDPEKERILEAIKSQSPRTINRKESAPGIPSTSIDQTVGRKPLDERIIKHLENLYPDSGGMVEYLDFMGYNPEKALQEAGYTVRWKGLRIVVSK